MKHSAYHFIAKSFFSYAKKHHREIATMLRDGLNMYLEAIPKRKTSRKK